MICPLFVASDRSARHALASQSVGWEAQHGRRGRPSPRRAPFAEVERFLRLYREQYAGSNARHFYQIARREHGVTLSYT